MPNGVTAHLDADRVGNAPEVLYVCSVQLARAVPNPDEVRTCSTRRVRACKNGSSKSLSLSLILSGRDPTEVVVFVSDFTGDSLFKVQHQPWQLQHS